MMEGNANQKTGHTAPNKKWEDGENKKEGKEITRVKQVVRETHKQIDRQTDKQTEENTFTAVPSISIGIWMTR